MNILDQFEQRVERMMEGGVNRLFRSPVHAADIGLQLERAMQAGLTRANGRSLAPDRYLVRMHPDDLARFAGEHQALETQLAEWLRGRIQERGVETGAPVKVSLSRDVSAARRQVRVEARRTATPTGDAAPGTFRLRFLNGPRRGQTIAVPATGLTLGRDAANDLVVDASEVSRHHARFERLGNRLRVVDLGSTNGTMVNQRPVRQTTLKPGDELAFGAVRVLVTADA